MTPAEEKAFKVIQESTERIEAAFRGLIASLKAASAAWAAIPDSAKEQALKSGHCLNPSCDHDRCSKDFCYRYEEAQTVESDPDDNKGGKHD